MRSRLIITGIVVILLTALAYVYVSRRPELTAGSPASGAPAAAAPAAGRTLSQQQVAVVTAVVERVPLALEIACRSQKPCPGSARWSAPRFT